MSNFTQSELNSIREIASGHQMMASKFNTYASQCQDPQIKQMFTNASKQAMQAANNLIQMI